MKGRYLHSKAISCVQSNAYITIGIAGRGWAKSTLSGARIRRSAKEMPGSLGALAGLTYTQLLSKVLPSMQKEWTSVGLKVDRPKSRGHYVIGRQPPEYFRRPINEPLDWHNFITFMNGSAIEMISADRPDLMAGGSYDYMIIDEAVYFPKDAHDVKMIPSLRGNAPIFGKSPLHGSRLYVSSQAWEPDGYWVEDQKYLRDEQDAVRIDSKGQPMLRKDVHFVHGTSWDNVAILGKKTISEWKRTLPSSTYDIEIMARRQEKVADAFYKYFERRKHCYTPTSDYDYDEQNEYGIYVKREDADRHPGLPLIWSFDFGVTFNSLVSAQFLPDKPEIRFLRNFYESSNDLLDGLVDQAANFYRNHGERIVHLYGDPSGNKIEHMQSISLFEKIEARLRSLGWQVENHMAGKAYPEHRLKHQFINELLKEQRPWARVRYNLFACKELLTSMSAASMTDKMKKNKSSERQQRDQATATHLSDAHDYLLYYFLYPMCDENGFSQEQGGDAGWA